MNTQVIAISGVTGVGKTTLTDALAQTLTAIVLRWDDFDDISISPIDYVDWYHRGKNYNEWDYQKLADVLKSLKAEQSVMHPTFKQLLQPMEYIIFDAPLGPLHPQTGRYIDTCIYLSLPLDISLCRHLIRDFKENERTKEELVSELEYYLTHSRPLFFDDDLKVSANFIIDGMLTTDEQIKKIKEYLIREKSSSHSIPI